MTVETLRILAAGPTPAARATFRGRLFEQLMATVLRQYGYHVDHVTRVNYAGMEIDIEGRHALHDTVIYVECKCYESLVDAPALQTFFGKFMTRWLESQRCEGMFVALPGLNSHAKGFWNENLAKHASVRIALLEHEQVLRTIYDAGLATKPVFITRRIAGEVGTPGDAELLYTDRGFVWLVYLTSPGRVTPDKIVLLSAEGTPIADPTIADYVRSLEDEYSSYDFLLSAHAELREAVLGGDEPEDIVHVRGSSSYFEYQFPASPAHFVGRTNVLDDVVAFVGSVAHKQTSARGILFEANSGWGKSSTILSAVERLNADGHFAVAIDSRTASSARFGLRVTSHVLAHFETFDGILQDTIRPVSGYESAIQQLVTVGRALEAHRRVLVVFFDQFENLFFRREALRKIRDIFLRLCDVGTNVVFGFAWKTDLFGLTSDFPYELRDAVAGACRNITVDRFSEVETRALLRKLSAEMQQPLRKELAFLLSEASQGYPWLLKKLCAHVATLHHCGVSQFDIANDALNVEQLFQDDLQGLSPEEEETLHRIARSAPVDTSSLDEQFSSSVVQSLVGKRLLLRIGHTCDVYWDIFREYLNSGNLPTLDNYMLRAQVKSIVRTVMILHHAGGVLTIAELQRSGRYTRRSYVLNLLRHLRFLGLAQVDSEVITLQLKLPADEEVETTLSSHLHDRLSRNRIVQRIREELTTRGFLSLEDVASVLKASSPYVSAREKTWLQYARVLASWMAFSGLGDVGRGFGSRTDGRLNLRGSAQATPYSQPVLLRD